MNKIFMIVRPLLNQTMAEDETTLQAFKDQFLLHPEVLDMFYNCGQIFNALVGSYPKEFSETSDLYQKTNILCKSASAFAAYTTLDELSDLVLSYALVEMAAYLEYCLSKMGKIYCIDRIPTFGPDIILEMLKEILSSVAHGDVKASKAHSVENIFYVYYRNNLLLSEILKVGVGFYGKEFIFSTMYECCQLERLIGGPSDEQESS